MISDNKRIAYNTIILYVKLIVSVVIGLYTSRLILLALGASDFGLYNVVGGVVSLLNIIGVTMVSTSYRYISVEIGKGEKGNPNKVYNTILTIHVVLALLFILFGVIIGFWYIDNYLYVDYGKISDARYVMVVSMITTALSILSVPSNGLIIAREKFYFTSITEITQTVLKLLLIVYVLKPYGGNRLRLYTNLVAFVTLLAPVSYTLYCYAKEGLITKWSFNKKWKDYFGVISFTGWMMISTLSFMGVAQGAAMIINYFFGTVVNAAFGIANQVQSMLMLAPRVVLQATSPQIMKSYGEGNQERALSLVYLCTKYCFFIFLLIVVPCILFMDELLCIWLTDVPDYTSLFTTFMIIATLVGALTNGLDPLVMATGKIRFFQLGYAVIFLSLLPIIVLLYKLGFPPYSNAIVMIILTFLSIITQLFIVCRISDFKIKDYFEHTLYPVLIVLVLITPLFILRAFVSPSSTPSVFIMLFFSFVWVGGIIYFAGLTGEEKSNVQNILIKKIGKRE